MTYRIHVKACHTTSTIVDVNAISSSRWVNPGSTRTISHKRHSVLLNRKRSSCPVSATRQIYGYRIGNLDSHTALDGPCSCQFGRIDRGLDGSSIIRHAISNCSVVSNVEHIPNSGENIRDDLDRIASRIPYQFPHTPIA